jgi:hypothetical protein
MENYNKVKECVENKECKLLTMFEDFEIKRETVLNKSYLFVRIDFIGLCGHNSNAVFTNFKSRGTGIRCKECVKKDTSTVLKNNDKLLTHNIETNSINLITKYLLGHYDIVRTNEGCRADLAIKEIGKEDKWIPIQVKSTEKICHKMYSFRGLKAEYKDMLLICVCTSEEKIWVIPYNELNIKCSTLNISEISKYNDYGCGNNLILNRYIDMHKNKCVRQLLDECLLPVSDLQQREQEYVKKREKYIDFLKFETLEIQNTPTDFMVNGKRVQEKVTGYIFERSSLIFYLATHNGSKKFRAYKLGENEYYWIHSSIDDRFWIIPEIELYNRGYISDIDKIIPPKSMRIRVNNENDYGVREWIKSYEYNYSNPNRNKIIRLFE